MADVKLIFPFFIVYTLTDVIIKVTVADLITTFLAEVIVLEKILRLKKIEVSFNTTVEI